MSFKLDAVSQVRLLCATVNAGDGDRVRDLLAQGCAFSHPDVDDEPVSIALELRNAEIAEALLDAGAPLPEARVAAALETAVREDRPRLFQRALGDRKMKQHELDGFLHDSATLGYTAMCEHLLEMGANPRHREKGRSCFERAVDRGYEALVRAMLAKLSQQDKDEMLAESVKAALARSVGVLIDAGADLAQRIDGRTLPQVAPRDAEDVKRLLRAAKTASQVTSAMSGDTGQESTPARPTLTL